jgi:hypothetical protein
MSPGVYRPPGLCRVSAFQPVAYADASLGLFTEPGVVVLVPVLKRRAGVELRHGTSFESAGGPGPQLGRFRT